MPDILVCSSENGVRCDLLEGWWPHFCDFDDNHSGNHQCACGHVWGEEE